MADKIMISGASDDLIEIDGAIQDEFPIRGPVAEALVGVSDGTLLRVAFGLAGVWRITPVVRGRAELTIEQCPEFDEAFRTDVATLSGERIDWVVCGNAYAKAAG